MAKEGALQFFPTDLATDLDPLGMEERGMYWTYVRQAWPYGGPMPIDEVEAVIEKPWLSTTPLFQRRFTVVDGLVTLTWLEERRAKNRAFSELQAEKGRKGGRPVKGKKLRVSRGITKQKPKQSPRDGNGIGNGNGSEDGKGKVYEAMVWPSFKEWWTLYDKSRDKADCEAEWNKLDQATRELAYRHTEGYVQTQPDKLYRKDPIRYLKKKGWNDELIAPSTNPKTQSDEQRKRELAAEALRRFGSPV